MRKDGFYWVKANNNNWIIAESIGNRWFITGDWENYSDNHFIEINEDLIILPKK